MQRNPGFAATRAAGTSLAGIECTGLTTDHGTGHGVFDLDLSVERGQTFGFIGRNGRARRPGSGCSWT